MSGTFLEVPPSEAGSTLFIGLLMTGSLFGAAVGFVLGVLGRLGGGGDVVGGVRTVLEIVGGVVEVVGGVVVGIGGITVGGGVRGVGCGLGADVGFSDGAILEEEKECHAAALSLRKPRSRAKTSKWRRRSLRSPRR